MKGLLNSETINRFIETVDPFNTYKFGGRSFEPKAGYISEQQLVVPNQHSESGQITFDRIPRYENINGIFVYTGKFPVHHNQFTKEAANQLYDPNLPSDVLLFNSMGDADLVKPYSLQDLLN